MAKKSISSLYDGALDTAVKTFALNVETYSGDRRDQSISSGMLCTDLILGNGGWISGWHTSLGFEQAAKTTTASHTLVEAHKLQLPIKQVWDYERTLDPQYISNMHNNDGSLTPDSFGKRDKDGKWTKRPEIWSFQQDIGEDFFDAVHKTLKALPNKQRIGDDWFLVFDKTTANKKRLGEGYDKKLYRTMDKYCVPCENGRPQGFLMLDSYPTMNPGRMDEDEGSNQMAVAASMFSKHMPRVKGLLGSKKVVLVGINQMRLRPGPSFGNPEYEPCGEALKLNSDVRLKHRRMAPPQAYKNYGTKEGQDMVEPSWQGGGPDVYGYIKITVQKNKVGGAPKGTEIFQRIWVSDFEGVAHGLDPVFDVWQYLMLTGQLSGNLKAFTINAKFKTSANGKKMSLLELKTLMLGDKASKKKVAKKLKIEGNPRIAENCWKQLREGDGYKLFKVGEAEEEDEDEDDDDE